MKRQFTLNADPVDARQFEVTVKQLANSLNFGQEESVFHGGGLEYAQSRRYVAGDPVKLMRRTRGSATSAAPTSAPTPCARL